MAQEWIGGPCVDPGGAEGSMPLCQLLRPLGKVGLIVQVIDMTTVTTRRDGHFANLPRASRVLSSGANERQHYCSDLCTGDEIGTKSRVAIVNESSLVPLATREPELIEAHLGRFGRC